MDLHEMAATADKALEAVMKVEPAVATAIGMFVPGAAPITAAVQPWVLFLAPYLERSLEAIAADKNGDLMDALIELLQHVSSKQPNSAALTPVPVAVS